MRKAQKNKSKSVCGLCKPHKRGWVNRWKHKDISKMKATDKEMKLT